MQKWRDTVMNTKQIRKVVECYTVEDAKFPNRYIIIANTQASISFKAGQREVVEFMDKEFPYWRRHIQAGMTRDEWQAQLKRWGV